MGFNNLHIFQLKDDVKTFRNKYIVQPSPSKMLPGRKVPSQIKGKSEGKTTQKTNIICCSELQSA